MTGADKRRFPMLFAAAGVVPRARCGSLRPPPDFRLPAIAVTRYFDSTALDSSASLHARTAPQTPLASKQDACHWTLLHPLEDRRSANGVRPRASQHLCAISLTHAGERCNVYSEVNQVVRDSRTSGPTTRAIVARSPFLSARTIPHPVLSTLPAISAVRHPLSVQVRHALSPFLPERAPWGRHPVDDSPAAGLSNPAPVEQSQQGRM